MWSFRDTSDAFFITKSVDIRSSVPFLITYAKEKLSFKPKYEYLHFYFTYTVIYIYVKMATIF